MTRTVSAGGRTIEYELVRKSGTRMSLRRGRDGLVTVTAPRLFPVSAVDAFVRSAAPGIFAAEEKAESRRKALGLSKSDCAGGCRDGMHVLYLGRAMTLRIQKGGRSGLEIAGGELVLTVRDPDDEAACRRALDSRLREKCAAEVEAICARVLPLFEKYGVSAPEVRFRSMKSQWGNCRPRENVLTFNTRLITVPEECIEYVVVHEFSHFMVQNHSEEFYKYVSAVLPDWKQRRRLIRKFEIW